MIYICEYKHQADERIWQERENVFLPFFDETSVSPAKRQKQQERILARLLLNFGLKKEYGISLAQLAPYLDENGKLRSKNYPHIHFNISHCSAACACMLGEREVGIDIERPFEYREKLARRICSAEEWEILQSQETAERVRQLRFLWSLKESFVKWNGRGIAYGMERADFAAYLPVRLQAGRSCVLEERKTMPGQARTGGREILRGQDGSQEQSASVRFFLFNSGRYTLAACTGGTVGRSVLVDEKEVLQKTS